MILLLIIIFVLIFIFVFRSELKIFYLRLKSQNNKSNQLKIKRYLFENVPIYKYLPDKYRKTLIDYTEIISKTKTFEGIDIEIDDEIKYTISGLAAILYIGKENLVPFPNLNTIIVYPHTYMTTQKDRLGISKKNVNLGESWVNGTVVLSWDAARKGSEDFSDGHNVVLHEFAHQLDQQTGYANAIPANLEIDINLWHDEIEKEYNNLINKIKNHQSDIIDRYGATNEAEFFAVVTETFFEKPKQFKEDHSELYEFIKNYYKFDPNEVYGEENF